jgi:hypothetical protein
MPATSLKQKHLMDAVAHNPAFAKKVGIPQSVGADFSEASKGMTFGSSRASTQGVNKPKTDHGAAAPFKRGGLMKSEKSMGMAKKLAMSGRNGETAEMAMKKGGKTHVKKMASGGITTAKMDKAEVGGKLKHGEHTIQKKGHTRALEEKMSAGKPLGMKHGGKTHHKR